MGIELDETGQDWRAYLKAVDKGGSPKRNSEVTTGLWRLPSNKLYATPIMTLFNEHGVMEVTFPVGAPFLDGNPTEIDPDSGEVWHSFQTTIWPKVKAVTWDEYELVKNGGAWDKDWSDNLKVNSRLAIGGNNPPEDATEKLLREARENEKKAKALAEAGEAKTQKAVDAAAVLIASMSSQRSALDEARKKEKEPYLRAGQAVDEKFNPLIASMKATGVSVQRQVVDPFLRKQEEIANAAKAAAQKVIDDAAAAAAAEAKADAEKRGEAVTDEQWNAAAPTAPAVEISTPKVSAGVKGARTSLSDVRSGKVDDYERFAAALAKARNSEILTLLDTIGHKMARLAADNKDGDTIYPGLKLVITRQSR